MSIFQEDTFPFGFSMALAMDLNAMNRFSSMTEAEKEEILNRARDAKSKDDMAHIVSEISDNRFF